MSRDLVRSLASGAAAFASVLAIGCGSSGEPNGGSVLRADEVRLQVYYYDTIPREDSLPLWPGDLPITVVFDTVRNPVGYPMLHANITATNLSNRSLIGWTGTDCWGWWFRVHDNPEREGEPVWTPRFCRGYPIDLMLPAGGTQRFPPVFIYTQAILESRGPGTYYLSARLQGKLGSDTLGTGGSYWLTDWIPAGTVNLVFWEQDQP